MPVTEQDAIRAMQAIPLLGDDPARQQKAKAIHDAYKKQQTDAGKPLFGDHYRQKAEQEKQIRSHFQDRVKFGFDDDKFALFNETFASNPAAKTEYLNEKFLAHTLGKPVDEVRRNSKAYREEYSRNAWGDSAPDDGEFYNRVAADFDTEDAVADWGQKAALKGLTPIQAFEQMPEELRTSDAFKRREWDFRRAFEETANATAARVGPYRQTIMQTVEDLQETMGVEGAQGEAGSFRDFAQRLIDIPKDDRGLVLSAIIENAGGGEDKSGMKKLAENFARGARDMALDIPALTDRAALMQFQTFANQGAGIVGDASTVEGYLKGLNERVAAAADPTGAAAIGRTMEGGETVQPSDEIKAQAAALIETQMEAIDLANDLRQIADEDIDPAKGEYMVTRGLYGAARSIPYTIAAALPGGAALTTAALTEGSYQSLRRANPGMTRNEAMAISAVAGPIQGALEQVSVGVLKGKLPTLGAFFNKAVATKGSAATRFGIRAVEASAIEMVQENLQDVTPFAIQGAVAALGADVPDVPWNQIYGDDFWNQQGELFFAVLPLALIGAGVGTASDFRGARDLMANPRAVATLIGNEAKANEIAELAGGGKWDKAQSILREELRNVKADSAPIQETRIKAAQELRQQAEVKAATIAKGEEMGILPAIGRTAEGWSVRFDDGTKRAFPTYSEADSARWTHAGDTALKVHEATRAVIQSVESQLEAGREVSFTFSNERKSLLQAEQEGQVTREAATNRANIAAELDGQTQKPAEKSDEDLTADLGREYEEAFTAAELASIEEDDRLASLIILGENQTAFADGVQRTTIKLYQGATPLTVIEEKLEGDAQLMIQGGKRDWLMRSLRRYERMSGEKVFLSGKERDSDLTDGDLKEAWSHLGQSYFVGRSRKGDVGDRWKSANFRQFAATVLKSPLGGAFEGYAQFFKAVWKRAAKLNKMRKEGRLDAELERELARSVGFGEQAEYEAGIEAEAARLKEEIESAGFEAEPEAVSSFQVTEDAPFSVLEVSRGRPKGKIEFPNNGISGPSGSRLTGYEWQFKLEEVPDQEGELVFRRFSDWDKAEQSADTGRSIVHQFQVERPDGSAATVSLESAIKELGFTANEAGAKPVKDLASSVKSLAKLQLKLAVLQNKAEERGKWVTEFEREYDRVKNGPKPKWEAVVGEGDFPNVPKVAYSMNGVPVKDRFGKDQAALVESGQWERDNRNFYEDFNEYARKLATEKAGPDPVGDTVESDVLATKKQIRKFEQKIAAASQEEPSFSVISNAESRVASMFSPFLGNPEQKRRIVLEAQKRTAEKAREWQPILNANRTNVDIETERKRREQELIGDKLDLLSPAEIGALEASQVFDNVGNSPILSDILREKYYKSKSGKMVRYWRGSLMSKSAAGKAGKDTKGGEWDGIPEGLPPYVWGGTLTPDRAAAQFGFDSVDDFWTALSSEIASNQNLKKDVKNAMARVRELEKEAKAESNTWAESAKRKRKTTGNDRATLIGAMRTLDAMISALPAEVRGKIGGFVRLAQFKTPGAMMQELEKRADRMNRELERWLKAEADKGVKALFETAKPAKDQAGKKRVGKAGADIHDLFDTLRNVYKQRWSADQAEAYAVGLEAEVLTGELSAEEEAHKTIEAQLVRLFGGWNDSDAVKRNAALDEATRIWKAGYLEYQQRKAEEKEQRDGIRNGLRSDLGTKGLGGERDLAEIAGLKFGAKSREFMLGLLNFEQLVSWTFGRGSKWATWFADEQRKAENAKQDAITGVIESVDDLFTELAGGRFKGEQLQFRMSRKSLTATDSLGSTRQLSELEALTALLMWQQEDGKRHMRGKRDEEGNIVSEWAYDETFLDELSGQISPEGWKVLTFLQEQYGKEYEGLNAVYSELHGVNLPSNPNYSPLTMKPQQAQGGQTVDPVTGTTASNGSMTPGSLRTRGTATAEPDFRDALKTFIAHRKQIEHWKATARFSRDAQAILGNREVGNSVEAKHGKEAVSVIRKWLDAIAQGGTRDAAAGLAASNFFTKIIGNASQMALVGRAGTIAIQATQLGAAAAKMPTGAYVVRLGKLLSGNLGWKESLDSPYIQRRMTQRPVLIQQLMEGLRAGKPTQIKHQVRHLGGLISGADAVFTAGTYAMVYDYQFSQAIKAGMTPAEAKETASNEAERITDEIAQPTRLGARSYLEVSSTNPFMRFAWAFGSEARKNAALMGFAAGKGTAAERYQAILFVVAINGLLGSVIRNAWRDARGDDDDEVFDEKYWSAKRLALSTTTDWLFGFPVIGEEVQNAIFALAGEYKYDSGLLEPITGAPKAAGNILTGESTDVLRDVEKIMTAIGLFEDNTAAATSFMHMLRDVYGLGRNFTK